MSNKCVCGPGDVWACPRFSRILLETENGGQTISDPGQKLIVYTLPSIWQYPFFQNAFEIHVICQNWQIQKVDVFCVVLPNCMAKGPGPGRLGFGLGGNLGGGGGKGLFPCT